MSVAGLSPDPNKICKNSFHWRNDSGELDVFEAARYFSGANENPGYNNAAISSQNFIRDDRPHGPRAARMSLDVPSIGNPIHPDINLAMDQKQLKENKKYKQPSSPGRKLASFLNSLFNPTTAKKKKSKSGSSTKDPEEESPGGIRRKRRSSISHFRITTTSGAANDSKSMHSSSVSGFRTPPICANTPTKSLYKDFEIFSDQQQKVHVSVPKNGANAEKSTDCDEKFRFSNGNIFKNGNFGLSDRNSTTNIWADHEEREFRKFSDVDDGADTDSSSDLFDLPNHDLDFYSNGLPVYGTTHMDRIRIGGAPISTAATV